MNCYFIEKYENSQTIRFLLKLLEVKNVLKNLKTVIILKFSISALSSNFTSSWQHDLFVFSWYLENGYQKPQKVWKIQTRNQPEYSIVFFLKFIQEFGKKYIKGIYLNFLYLNQNTSNNSLDKRSLKNFCIFFINLIRVLNHNLSFVLNLLRPLIHWISQRLLYFHNF